jgi:hypothetical protein
VTARRRPLRRVGARATIGPVTWHREHGVACSLLIVGGCIFIVRGCLHRPATAVDAFRPTRFAPADDDACFAAARCSA